jgi:hypothetical protein
MARKSPNVETLKLLYVRSGNECAFPDCYHPIFNDNGLYIAQLCHINAANIGGQRYDHAQSDAERRSTNNLMFMCHRHHKETDDEKIYTAEKLKKMKFDHELKYTEFGKEANSDMIRQVLHEVNYFWDRQSKKKFDLEDLKIERNFEQDIFELIKELIENIQKVRDYCDICAESDTSKKLQEDLLNLSNRVGIDFSKFDEVPYYKNPFINRNWEMHNIGRPNLFSHISLSLNQLKVKIVDQLLKYNPNDHQLKKIAEKYRQEFENAYDRAYYVD